MVLRIFERKKASRREAYNVNSLKVIPTGFEPISKEPESFILSIELGDRYFLASTKIVKLEFNQRLSIKNIKLQSFFYQIAGSPSHNQPYQFLIVDNFCKIKNTPNI